MSVERGRSYKHAKSAGKGWKQRPMDMEKYRKHYDEIFRQFRRKNRKET